MHLCERKKNFIKIPTLILYLKFYLNIDFRLICHFDVKGTRLVGLEVSVILTQTVGKFDMRVTPKALLYP